MEKKTEKVISSFETNDSLVIEMETTIEFKTSGGLYLPGLDDNFLSDQTVTFALVSPPTPEIRYSAETSWLFKASQTDLVTCSMIYRYTL